MADTGRLDELQRKFDENPRRFFAPLANEYRKAGNLERSIELCREYLPQQPGHMSGYIVYGQALFDGGRYDEAIEAFKQALSVDPENIIALKHLGDIARGAGEHDVAAKWYRRVLELDPKNDEVAAYLADASHGDTIPAVQAVHSPYPPPASPPLQTIHPEPTPDPNAVALSDLVTQPDVSVEQVVEQGSELPLITEFTISVAPEPQTQEQPAPSASSSEFDTPFVTETMADLYLQQGFFQQALDVYRRLAANGDDPQLREKIERLERSIKEQEAREQEAREQEAKAQEAAAAPVTPPVPVPTVTVRDFFARIGARRPQGTPAGAPPPSPSSPPSASELGNLFGSAHIEEGDTRAASALAGAFPAAR